MVTPPQTTGFCLCTQKLGLSTKQVSCRSAAEGVSWNDCITRFRPQA